MVIWLIPSPFHVHMVYEWPLKQMVLWSMDWVYQDTRRGTAVSGGLNLEVTGTKNTQKKSNPDSPGRKKVRLEQKPFLWKHAKDLTTSYPNRICNELSSFFLFAHRARNHFYPKKRSSFIPLLFMNKQPKCDIVL